MLDIFVSSSPPSAYATPKILVLIIPNPRPPYPKLPIQSLLTTSAIYSNFDLFYGTYSRCTLYVIGYPSNDGRATVLIYPISLPPPHPKYMLCHYLVPSPDGLSQHLHKKYILHNQCLYLTYQHLHTYLPKPLQTFSKYPHHQPN